MPPTLSLEWIATRNGHVFKRFAWTGGDGPIPHLRRKCPVYRALVSAFFRESLAECGGLNLWKCAGTSALERARIFWNRARLDAWRTLNRADDSAPRPFIFYIREKRIMHPCARRLAEEKRGLCWHLPRECPDCRLEKAGFELWGENGHLQGFDESYPSRRRQLAWDKTMRLSQTMTVWKPAGPITYLGTALAA